MKDGVSVDFYWLSSGNVVPPSALVSLNLQYVASDATPLPPSSIAFFEPETVDLDKTVFHLRARYGWQFYLIVVIGSGDTTNGAALIERGADDVCTRVDLDHPETVIARAKWKVARRAGDAARLEPAVDLDFVRAGIDALPIPIFFKDARGAYLGCNQAFSQALGRNVAEIIGKTVYQTAHADAAERYAELDRQLLASGGHQIFEARHRFDDGIVNDAAVVKAVFHDEAGRVAGFAGAKRPRSKASIMAAECGSELRRSRACPGEGRGRAERSEASREAGALTAEHAAARSRQIDHSHPDPYFAERT